MARTLFTLPAYQFSIPDVDAAVGKWSRAGTYGDKSAKGEGLIFDVDTLSSFVDNARDRAGEIAIDQDHKTVFVGSTGQPAPSLGFFHALALFKAGELVNHWAFDGAPAPDGTHYDGQPRDGLYMRLGRVTPLGRDPQWGLANYSSLSLTFDMNGQAEDGTPIGPSLLCVAATSTPFLSGTPIEFSRNMTPSAPAKSDPPAPVVTATTPTGGTHRLGAAMDETEMAAKFGWEEGDDDAKKLAKCLAKFAADTKSDDAEEKKEEKEEGETMSADADKDDDKVKAMSATLAAVTARLTALEAEKSAREAAERATRDAEIEKFATEAVEAGYPTDSRAALVSFAKSDMSAARAMVAPLLASKTGAPAHLLSRVSANGAPLSGPTATAARSIPAGPVSFSRTMPNGDTVTEIDGAGAKAAREMAESKDPAIMSRVDALAASKFGGVNPLSRMLAAQKLAEEDAPHLFTRAG